MERPKLLIIAGPNGAGKTTVTSQILKHEWVEGCEYINPDFIARDEFGDWNSSEMVLKAAQFAEELRENCLKNHKSLIFSCSSFYCLKVFNFFRTLFRLTKSSHAERHIKFPIIYFSKLHGHNCNFLRISLTFFDNICANFHHTKDLQE